MKKIVKILSLALAFGMVLFQSCETTELDLRTNPNALSTDNADPNFLLNGIQETFIRIVESFGYTGSQVTRIDYMGSRQYRTAYGPSSFDGRWEDAYTEILTDTYAMYPLAEEAGLGYHIGMGKFMEAYTMSMLVDFLGDVPYSEANNGADNFNPGVDSGADIYANIETLLNEAIAAFNSGGVAPDNDFFYDGNASKWIKACNTLKLKIYITERLVASDAVSKFNSIISSGNYIQSVDDDMQFTWGTNEVSPDTRHPAYGTDYTTSGGGRYRSNSLMQYMMDTADPRIRYYFYRQNEFTPGSDGTDPNLETLQCSLQTAPAHYAGFPYCTLSNGYWGRDHGNNEGIPPDGFLRSLVGVYPAGGAFDDNRFEGRVLGEGGGGAGITPVLLASTVDFWRAELAMLAGNPGTAKNFVLAGLSKSVSKVLTFGSLDSSADVATYEPTATEISDHSDTIDAAFDADATGGWNVLGQEMFVALYGNGIDAYNFYRRTGYPSNLQPNLEPDPGSFIRSFFYPSNAANNNSNITQKATQTVQVFWDTNPAGPSFPYSN